MFTLSLSEKVQKSLLENKVPKAWIDTLFQYFDSINFYHETVRVGWFELINSNFGLFNARFEEGENEKEKENSLVIPWTDLFIDIYQESHNNAWDKSSYNYDENKINKKMYPQKNLVSKRTNPIYSDWYKFLTSLPQKEYTVMLIEDDVFLSSLQSELMRDQGLRVIPLSDPRKQVEIMHREKERLTLVVSGILQPFKDGLQMIEEVKKIDEIKDIPWIFSTNLAQDTIVKDALEKGAAGYLILSCLTPDQWLLEVLKFVKEEDDKNKIKEKMDNQYKVKK